MTARRCEAKLFLRFVDDLIGAGAVVFGGAPRDILLARHHADAFYAAGGAERDFDDPAVLPQFAERSLVPADVDAYMCDDDFARLDGTWSRMQLQQTSRAVCAMSTYMAVPNDATHYKYTLGVAKREYFDRDLMLASVHPDMRAAVTDCVARFTREMVARTEGCRRNFTLDLIVVPRAHAAPFLTHHDFDVNGLCMDERGVWLSHAMGKDALGRRMTPLEKHCRLQEVLEGVLAKRATYLGWRDDSNIRLVKMLNKGWAVPLPAVETAAGAYEGHCIVCHERFDDGAHHKLACCDARYHAACLVDASAQMICTERCIMCGRGVDPRAMFVDATILQPAAGERAFPLPTDPDGGDMPWLVDG